jgi:hypothetical protein
LVLVQIVFFDKLDLGVPFHWGFLEIYLVATLFMSLGQLAGIALVKRGYYLLGGYLQIISSGGQVLKVDGIFGVVGGLKALRYGRSLTAA